MYSEIPQGSKISVQGLECWIPPVGYVFNLQTKQIEYRGVHSRSDIKEEQFWERMPLPYWYKQCMKNWEQYDKKKKDDDEPFYDSQLEEYKKTEWDRRLNGFWFMNNGEPVYLNGSHYIFLQWWVIDIGFAKFRLPDLEYFYALQYCIEDPDCMGLIEVTKRRFGKTYRAGLFLYEYITRTRNTNGGIQSKTGQDAKKMFGKAVINPFKKLPRFFRPEYDMSLGVTPKTEIRFQQTNVRGKKAEETLDKDELGSLIDHQSADTVAYDGQKLHRYVADESGKTTEVNIYDRHEVIRYCLLDDEGRIIGKALYTTTVERMETERDGIQDAFKKLWDDSNQLKREENGRTSSGLYRFFMTADRARNFDIYGVPNVDKTVSEILADRKTVEHNQRSLIARIRKEARTIEEAFSIDSDQCVFNSINIEKQIRFLEENPPYLRTVLFSRKVEDQKVRWSDDKKGLWRIHAFPPVGEDNKYEFRLSIRTPGRSDSGLISIDGYTNVQGGGRYGSKAGAYIICKNEEGIWIAIAEFYGRPSEKSTLHEQILLACDFYGVKALWEHVADEYYPYFRDRGRIGYLMRYPMSSIDPVKRGKENMERHYGYPTTPFALTKALDAGVSYVENFCHYIVFIDLLRQMLVFDPADRTKSDLVVAFMNGLVGCQDPVYKPAPPKTPLIRLIPNTGVAPYN